VVGGMLGKEHQIIMCSILGHSARVIRIVAPKWDIGIRVSRWLRLGEAIGRDLSMMLYR